MNMKQKEILASSFKRFSNIVFRCLYPNVVEGFWNLVTRTFKSAHIEIKIENFHWERLIESNNAYIITIFKRFVEIGKRSELKDKMNELFQYFVRYADRNVMSQFFEFAGENLFNDEMISMLLHESEDGHILFWLSQNQGSLTIQWFWEKICTLRKEIMSEDELKILICQKFASCYSFNDSTFSINWRILRNCIITSFGDIFIKHLIID